MSPQPQIEHREAQPYVAIRTCVTMQGLAGAVDRYFPELFAWLHANLIEPTEAPFIRYLRVEMDRELEIELAVPVPVSVQGAGEVRADSIPAGRYVTLLHIGPYDGLVSGNARIQDWAKEHGIRWQMTDKSRWRARIERYLTDPSREPDPTRWQTELAYLAVEG